MGLDEMIERMAFGRALPKFSSCIGIALSNDVVYLAEAHMNGPKPAVDHLLRVPMPPAAGAKDTGTRVIGSLNTELLSDPERLAGILKPAMTQTQWGSKFAVMTLSHHFGLLRYFIMPAVDRKFWKMSIPAESKKYIPIQVAELTHDFQVVSIPPGPDKRPRQAVLFGITHQKNIEGATALCQKLGLTLIGVELASCSVQRLLGTIAGPSPAGTTVQLHFDGGWVRTLLSENGIPIFFREALLPDQARTPDVRKVDLSGCIDFCRKQMGVKAPAAIRLSGTTPEQAAWKDALSQDVNLPVQPQDIAQTLGLKAGEWGAYAALGTALKFLATYPLTVELSQFRRITDDEKRAVFSMFTLAGTIAGLMLLVGGVKFAMKTYLEQDLNRMARKKATISAFQGKSAEDIQRSIKEMEEKANSMARLSGARVKLTRVLEYIAEDTPDSAWLGALTYVSMMGAAGVGRQSQTLTLVGHVMAASPEAEQDVAFQFKNKLQADSRFGEQYVCNPPSVILSGGASSAQAPADSPDELSTSQENRTTFTIECSAK